MSYIKGTRNLVMSRPNPSNSLMDKFVSTQKIYSGIYQEENKALLLSIVLFFFYLLWILRNGYTHNEDNEIRYQSLNDSYKK
jgi:hypothetical protein